MFRRAPFALVIGLALALTPALMPQALALDGFWHGVRSDLWHQGTNGEISNWYTEAPASGDPQDVPNDTATFAPGALRKDVRVKGARSVQTVLYFKGNDKYTVRILPSSSLTIGGLGISNGSGTVQSYIVDGNDANLMLRNKAVSGLKKGKDISILNVNRGETVFKGKSKGGFSKIINQKGGNLSFEGRSTAGIMIIVNNSPKSSITFIDKSDGGDADFDNKKGALSIERTNGALGGGIVVFGNIRNNDKMTLGVKVALLDGDLTLTPNSKINISFQKKRTGAFEVDGKVKLDGKIKIFGSRKLKPGNYPFVASKNKISGKFSNVRYLGFRKNMQTSIAYGKNSARLVLTKK